MTEDTTVKRRNILYGLLLIITIRGEISLAKEAGAASSFLLPVSDIGTVKRLELVKGADHDQGCSEKNTQSNKEKVFR
jgi:hypothetical protein